jgi:hypothetical protein
MKPYTVMMMYPDYMTDDYGQETYMAWVEGSSLKDAVLKAQRKAVEESMPDETDHEYIETVMDDFFVIFRCEGHVVDLSSAAITELMETSD